jgi:hypothetical protein
VVVPSREIGAPGRGIKRSVEPHSVLPAADPGGAVLLLTADYRLAGAMEWPRPFARGTGGKGRGRLLRERAALTLALMKHEESCPLV